MSHKNLTRLSLVILVVINLLIRLPNFFEPAYSDDEHFFLTIGRAIHHGSILYRDISDMTPIRPPLIYLITSIFNTQFSFRSLLLVWNTITLIFFYLLVKKLTQSNKISFTISTALILLTSTTFLEGNQPYNELFYIGCTIIAIYLLLSPNFPLSAFTNNHLRLWLCGLFLGLGFLIKLPVIFDIYAITLTLILLTLPNRSHSLLTIKHLLFFLIGLITPIFITFVLQPISPDILQTQLVRILSLLVEPAAYHLVPNFLGYMTTKIAVLVFFTFFLSYSIKQLSPISFLIVLWEMSALISSMLMNYLGLHYTIQLVPPFLIGLALITSSSHPIFCSKSPGAKYRGVPVYKYFLLLPMLIFLSCHLFYESDYRFNLNYYHSFYRYLNHNLSQSDYYQSFAPHVVRNYAVADYVRTHTQPNDPIFVWGTYSEIYSLSQTLPSTKYIWHEHIEAMNVYADTTAQLNISHPKYIITFDESPLPNQQPLETYLNTYYHLDAQIRLPNISPYAANIFQKNSINDL